MAASKTASTSRRAAVSQSRPRHGHPAASDEPIATRRHAIWVDNFTRPDGESALTGHFADVVGGEHEGRYGVFLEALSATRDGFPDKVLFRTRDDEAEHLVVDYKHLRPAHAGRR